jgi:hypothetical protein
VNYRQWSVDAEKCKDPITHFTIKVYYRDPEGKLPSRIRQSRKENIIHQMVTYEGFRREECVGTKDQLLNKLQRCRPFVTFKIDGREGIQRVLNTALHQFGWSSDHMFHATMPLRGTSTVGCNTYQDILFPCFGPFAEYGIDLSRLIMLQSPKRTKVDIDREFAHLFQWQRDQMFEDIMDRTTNLTDIAPMRSFDGCGFDSLTMGDRDMFGGYYDLSDDCFLSLNDLALQKGDRIRYEYDFGDPSIFIAEIVKCEENQQLLPEMFSHDAYAAVRAIVVEESANKIRPQYPKCDEYEEDCFDSHSDY